MSTRTAKDSLFVKFTRLPNVRLMVGYFAVAIETRIPKATTFEFDSNDVESRMPVRTTSFVVNIYAKNFYAMKV